MPASSKSCLFTHLPPLSQFYRVFFYWSALKKWLSVRLQCKSHQKSSLSVRFSKMSGTKSIIGRTSKKNHPVYFRKINIFLIRPPVEAHRTSMTGPLQLLSSWLSVCQVGALLHYHIIMHYHYCLFEGQVNALLAQCSVRFFDPFANRSQMGL